LAHWVAAAPAALENRFRKLPSAENSPESYRLRRAMFWGSVLALWGTAGVFLTAKKSLGVETTADASDRLAAVVTPYADWFHQR